MKDERIFTETATQGTSDCIFTKIAEMFWKKSWKTAPWSLNLHSAISGDVHSLFWVPYVKPVQTPVAILGSLGVCIYVPASRHWLISYSPIHLT